MVLSLRHLESVRYGLLLLEAVHGGQLATKTRRQCLSNAVFAVGFRFLEGRPVKQVIFDVHSLRFQTPKLGEVLATEVLATAARLLDVLVCPRKLLSEISVLLFELLDHLGLGIVILHRHIRNLGGFRSIRQCALVLFKVLVARVEASYHAAKTVATEALLEKTGQFGVPVGHKHAVLLAIC